MAESNEIATSMMNVIAPLSEQSKGSTAVEQVEKSLTDLYNRLCASFEADDELENEFREAIKARKDEMSVSELLTAYELFKQYQNDKIGRTLGPSMGMMTEELRAKISAEARVEQAKAAPGGVQILQQFGQNPAEGGLPFSAPPSVLQGVDALIKLESLLGSPEVVDVEASESED